MTNEVAANVLRIMASGIELKGYTELWISGFREAYEMAFKSLEERPQGEWILVSERLPNCNGCYIVTRMIEDTAISDVCYFDGQNTWHSDNRVNHERPYLNDIIAWQPLPEPHIKGGVE